jgi:hypothetical protein
MTMGLEYIKNLFNRFKVVDSGLLLALFSNIMAPLKV